MTKKTCPVCEKTFTNLKKHLARKFKCKPPKEISKEISEEIIVDVLEDKQPEPMKEEESEEGDVEETGRCIDLTDVDEDFDGDLTPF